MTPDQRAAARQRCEKATAPPWTDDAVRMAVWADVGDNWVADCSDSFVPADDAAFIAHAREDLPLALVEIDRLRAWLEAIRGLPDVDGDNRGWMAERALAGGPVSYTRAVTEK